MSAEVVWCMRDRDGGIVTYGKPTPTDLLEEANRQLKDEEVFKLCRKDSRIKEFNRVEDLLDRP